MAGQTYLEIPSGLTGDALLQVLNDRLRRIGEALGATQTPSADVGSADLNMQNHRLVLVGDPVNPQDGLNLETADSRYAPQAALAEHKAATAKAVKGLTTGQQSAALQLLIQSAPQIQPLLSIPGNPTILNAVAIDTTPDASGNPRKQVIVQYSPPSPLGVFVGIDVYLDTPDSSIGSDVADGTQGADGTHAAAGPFQPSFITFAAYDPTNLQIIFTFPAPTVAQYWRVYLPPGSNNFQAQPIQAGQPNASPSFQFLVQPPAPLASGREVAPLVQNAALAAVPAGWAANPNVIVDNAGDQLFEAAFTWTWPTNDQNLQSLGGENLVLDNGITQKYLGNIDANTGVQYYALPPLPMLPGTKVYTLYIVSYNQGGTNNSIVPGVTPSVQFTVTASVGAGGIEYAGLAQNVTVTAADIAGGDGTALLHVVAGWTVPSVTDPITQAVIPDPRFAGAELVALKPDGFYYSIAQGRISPIYNDVSNPASAVLWKFFLRSINASGLRNSIVPGTTPEVDLTVGGPNKLNLGQAASSSFNATQFGITSGKLNVIGGLSADWIVTGILQVGGGGSKVSKFTIFDTLSSLIGWIGDDTGVSGFVGAWFKQIRIGGANPASAPFLADSSGNTSWTFTGGAVTVNVDATNFIKVTDTGLNQYVQMNGSQCRVTSLSDATNFGILEKAIVVLQQTVGGGNMTIDAHGANPTISINGTQVLTKQQGGTSTIAGTAGGTYTATEQGLINSLLLAVNILINVNHGHGLMS